MVNFTDIFTFSRASKKWVINASGTLEEVATGQPAFDYSTGKRGLLLESQSTNLFSNNAFNTFGLTVPQTVGNISIHSGGGGLTTSIEGRGLINGVPYIDYRVSGTNTSGGIYYFNIKDSAASTAAVGETYAVSAYLAVIAGTLPVDGLALSANFKNAVVGALSPASETGRYPAITSTLTRHTATFTAPASTATVRDLGCYFRILNGATVDVTIRVGGLQVEKQSVATSLILTTGSQVTRAADLCYIPNIIGLYGGYSAICKFRLNAVQGSFDSVFQLDTGEIANRHTVRWDAGNAKLLSDFFAAGVSQGTSSLGGALGADAKVAYKVAAGAQQSAINGVAKLTDTSFDYVSPSRLYLGVSEITGSARPVSLHVYSLEILGTQLTEAELIGATT